jgi:hypothetical protein
VNLADLAEKYQRMLALRHSLTGPPDAATRAQLKQLARDFPGALRELDTLPTDEIERRLAALAGGSDEPWVRWMARFHTLMKAALHIKVRDGEPAQLAADAGVDEAFARAVKSPSHGRLMVVVFERIAAEEGRDRGELWDALFPPRKGPRDYRRR